MKKLYLILRRILSHPIGKQRPLNVVFRFLKWQVISRFSEEIIEPFHGELKLALRRGMTGATGNYYCGLLEFPEMVLVAKYLTPNSLFIDVGSNVGVYSILASGFCRCNSIAIEPDQAASLDLMRNIKINKLANLIEVQQVAVSDKLGKVTFTTGKGVENSITDSSELNTINIDCAPIDIIVGDRVPNVMKIDVEGHEEKVILGSSRALEHCDIVIIETLTAKIRKIFDDNGFVEIVFDPLGNYIEQRKKLNEHYNYIFVKEKKLIDIQKRIDVAPKLNVLGIFV